MATSSKTSSTSKVTSATVSANQKAAAKLGVSIPGVGGKTSSASSAPSGSAPHSDGSWIDPTRAPGDSHTRTANNVEADDGTMTKVQGTSTLPGQTDQQPNPAVPTQVQNKITNPAVGSSSLSPVPIAPAPTPTPPPSKYAAGLAAANASGAPAPASAGEARYAAQTYMPSEGADTTMTDSLLSSDPGMTKLMQGITQLLQPAKQSTSLLQDYKKLYKQSGLDEINQELIDADTVINGTEDDIRNEIQGAGGFGTDSQVQAMSLARNKGLLKRYNQLVQMKTDATNQLNTMSSLNAQDKQMAQQRTDSQINAMFQLANFRQQAQNNVKEQFRWLTTTMGVDGIYNAYKSDPRQLAFLENTLGVAPGGMAGVAAQAAKQRGMETSLLQAQINSANRANQPSGDGAPTIKTINGVDMQWNSKTGQWEAPSGSGAGPGTDKTISQLDFLTDTANKAKGLAGESGQGAITRTFGDIVGGSKYRQLETYADTLRVNMLALSSDPSIKKFFGPQMSNADVLLMTAAGTTLRPQSQSPAQLKDEVVRIEDFLTRAKKAVNTGAQQQPGGQYVTSPTGQQILITD